MRRAVAFSKNQLLKMFREGGLQLLLRGEADPFLQDISIRVQQVQFGLVTEAERTLKTVCTRVVRIQEGELDLAEILCFKPMNHGRHRAAGRSGEAEEFHQLQSA
jgi:hypothetical protein